VIIDPLFLVCFGLFLIMVAIFGYMWLTDKMYPVPPLDRRPFDRGLQ